MVNVNQNNNYCKKQKHKNMFFLNYQLFDRKNIFEDIVYDL